MKLISMTDYVLEQEKNIFENKKDTLKNVWNYANFLKQSLELWMFVSCDENGNILEEIKPYQDNFYKYEQAKEICIFNNNNLLSFIEIKELIAKGKTIEYLINYHYEKTGSYLETIKMAIS